MAKTVDKNIISIIDDLFEYGSESKLYFKHYNLSFQDHWLTVKEADAAYAMLNYSDYLKFLNIEIQIVDFFVKFHNVHTITYYNNNSYKIEDFSDEGELIKILIDGLREIEKFILYVKSMDLIFISNFDQDISVYFISDVDHKIFIDFVRNCNLHLLE